MKKIITLVVCSLGVFFVSLGVHASQDMSGTNVPIIAYPLGEDFLRLKRLIDTNFSPPQSEYTPYNCIAGDSLCPNYRYTRITENALKMLVMRTYTGNEEFYATLFTRPYERYYLDSFGEEASILSREDVLANIPSGESLIDWRGALAWDADVGATLLDASFGLGFSQDIHPSSLLGAIDDKIQSMKRDKCQMMEEYSNCPWRQADISSVFLPTPAELLDQEIFFNSRPVRLDRLKDEFVYTVEGDIVPATTLATSSSSDTSLV